MSIRVRTIQNQPAFFKQAFCNERCDRCSPALKYGSIAMKARLQMLDHPFDHVFDRQLTDFSKGLKNTVTRYGTGQEMGHLLSSFEVLQQRSLP